MRLDVHKRFVYDHSGDPIVRRCRNETLLHHGEVETAANGDSGAMRLTQLNAASRIEDLRLPPSNRLEALKHDRAGQWSIRVNDQWRVCFRFESGDAFDVEIVDYH